MINVQKQKWHYGTRYLLTTEGGSVGLEFYDEPTDEVEAYISALWVEEPHRRKGIATALMNTAEEIARREGYKSVWLEWRDTESEEHTLKWYLRRGYDDKKFGRGYALLEKKL